MGVESHDATVCEHMQLHAICCEVMRRNANIRDYMQLAVLTERWIGIGAYSRV